MKQKTIWQIEDRKEFYDNLESVLRRDQASKGLDYCITHFVGQHFEEMSEDFLREMKDKIDWRQVYKAIIYNGKLIKIKGKKLKEFFKGYEKWDI